MENVLAEPVGNTDVPERPIGNLLYDAFKNHDKNSVALVDLTSGEIYTYGQLIEYSLNLATSLYKLGLRKNDVIAVISGSSHKFIVAFLAGLYLATPLHLMNPSYTTYELKKMLSLSNPKVTICTSKSYENLLLARQEIKSIETVIIFDDLDVGNAGDVLFYKDLIRPCGQHFNNLTENLNVKEEVAFICNSSGTTGLPKGVMITHECSRLDIVHATKSEISHTEKGESILMVIPFFHIYGLNITKNSLYLGAKVIVMDQFKPKEYLSTIQDHKVKKLFVVPSLTNFLAKTPLLEEYNLSSVDEMFSAAAPPCEEIYKAVTAKFGLKTIRQIYGTTETCAGVTILPRDEIRTGSCGKLLPGRKAKIVDIKTGEVLKVRQPGEICVGNYIMKGYMANEQVTKETIDQDGFLHTGDVGYYDEEGYFYIIDRLKDLIKYKGYQVAPVEVEDVLLQHPGVKDVGVVGKPDERFGELPVAFVVIEDGAVVNESDIIEHVANHLCVQKQLHGGVRFVKDIPKNQVGKTLRKQLREML